MFNDYKLFFLILRPEFIIFWAIFSTFSEHSILLEKDIENFINIDKYYLQSGGLFWIVEKNNKIFVTAGFYPYKKVEKRAEIKKIYLLSQARGIGLGKFLLHKLELEIATRRFSSIWITTINLFKEATSLYKNSGYSKVIDIETPENGYIYYKKISDQYSENSIFTPQTHKSKIL
ncbi:MAG: GNAT family N-acetyltransferase [Sphaerospermopsis sp. SIO1G2]|nr:GNAT family N-acetyltransferase [Sphaerospermopsis sp. SIO1G2]